MERLKKWMVLAALPGWGSVRVKKFVESSGSLDLAWNRAKNRVDGFSAAVEQIKKEIEFGEHCGDWSISWESAYYPVLWRSIVGAPVIVHGRGRKEAANSQIFAAIVGTRKCCEESSQRAHSISEMLSDRNWSVVSGLARGVDAAAHRGALFAKGTTLACLGHGLDRMYPAIHKTLANCIVNNGGALLSEFSRGSKIAPWQFAARNRLVVGLSEAVIVIESPLKGGAMVSAACAIESGRDLWVYRPKQWSSRWGGNQMLIRAYPDAAWSNPEELMLRMGLAVASRSSRAMNREKVPEALQPVWASLVGSSGKSLNQLMIEHEASREQMTRRLFLLELCGKIQRLPGGWYVPLLSGRRQG